MRVGDTDLVLDPLLGLDALVVGVLDLAHLGDGVGEIDDLLRRIASGEDHVGRVGPVAKHADHVGGVATMLVTTDSPVPQEVADRIAASDGFEAGRTISI